MEETMTGKIFICQNKLQNVQLELNMATNTIYVKKISSLKSVFGRVSNPYYRAHGEARAQVLG